MKARTLLLGGLLLGLISGSCYRPTYSNCLVHCSLGVCPGSLMCVAGLCTDGTETCSRDAEADGADVMEVNPPETTDDLGAADTVEDADGGNADRDETEPGDTGADGGDAATGELPGRLANLDLWLDALVGLREGPPFVWEDRSDAHNDARQDGADYPTVGSDAARGGLPYVHFNGIGDFVSLAQGFGDFQKGMTIFAIVRVDVSFVMGNRAPLIDFSAVAGNAGDSIVLSRSGADDRGMALVVRAGNASVSEDGATDVLQNRKWMLLEVVLSGGSPGSIQKYRVLSMGNEVVSEIPCYTPKVMTRTSNLIGKSNNPQNANAHLHGDLASLIVYSRALSDGERGQIEGYLIDRWRL